MEEGIIIKNKTKSLKTIIAVLSTLLVGSGVCIYNVMNDSKAVEEVVISQKQIFQKDLSVIKDSLDSAIASNTVMSEDLMIERDKVVKLMAEIENTKADIASLQTIKANFSKLKEEVVFLVKENNALKKKNRILTIERDSTAIALVNVKKNLDTLTAYNKNLTKTIEKGAKLSFIDLGVLPYKLKSSGEMVSVEKASRVDVLMVNFSIAENKVAKQGNRTFFVQVLDVNNNVLGEKNVEEFEGGNSIIYSYRTTVKYRNEVIKTTNELRVSDLKKGTYYVNIFDKSEMVAKTTFELR